VNRFEQAVYDCMTPTAELLARTIDPLHRAILLNFWRHVHLEGAGEYKQIVAPDMMVDEPVYRVTWGAKPAVISAVVHLAVRRPRAPRRRASVRGQDESRDRRGQPRRGDHAGARPRDPPGAAGEARGRARRPLLGPRRRVGERIRLTTPGGVPERSNGTVLKTVGPSRGPWVRIPAPPL
jgi:hypothetical protein